MKKPFIAFLLFAIAIAVFAVAVAFAADPPRGGRVDTRTLAGFARPVQDEFYRLELPTFIQVGNTSPFLISNSWEGQYFVNTNTTLGLPNPTNNFARKIAFMALGTNTFYVSNGTGGQLLITSSNIVAPLCLINSNRQAMAWSTGTNWLLLP